mgnify:CR=1 FL=1
MLIKSIPSDVELYILEFLIMPLDIKRLKKVSRSVENMINNTKYIIEKNRITNQILMMNEDNQFQMNEHNIDPLLLNSLADSWNKFYKWSWITPTKEKVINDYWTVGEIVDVLDKIEVWGPAYIKDVKIEPYGDDFIETRRMYNVEFLGWSNNFDEWVPYDKIAKLGTKTFNPLKSFESLHHEHNFWVLFNNPEEGWKVSICNLITKYEKEKKIKINLRNFHNSYGKEITLDEKNKFNHLKPITNISAFLCATEKSLELENKKILM